MEGNNIKDNHITEQQPYPQQQYSRQKRINLPLIIGSVIILIVIIMTSVVIIDMWNEEIPEHKQYTKFEGDGKTVYKNENLNVTITKAYDSWDNEWEYQAKWFSIYGHADDTDAYSSTTKLYNAVLVYAEILSVNQLRWFDFMLKNIVM
jgi:hypothetical protein